MSALERKPSILQRSSSVWRRLSRRDRSNPSAPDPASPSTSTPSTRSTPSPAPRKLQKRQATVEFQMEKQRTVITHLQRIDVPSSDLTSQHQPKPTPAQPPSGPKRRVLASDMQTTSFPKFSPAIHTVAWNVSLTPHQVYNLVMGSHPQAMEDKWFIYSEGPDRAGKLKVHFHRSCTGIKMAELFVLIDVKGEGAGKIVGIKWNSSEETNGMDEEEVKYMIATTCAWVLGVNIESGVWI